MKNYKLSDLTYELVPNAIIIKDGTKIVGAFIRDDLPALLAGIKHLLSGRGHKRIALAHSATREAVVAQAKARGRK
jgi:hypothetical protein